MTNKPNIQSYSVTELIKILRAFIKFQKLTDSKYKIKIYDYSCDCDCFIKFPLDNVSDDTLKILKSRLLKFNWLLDQKDVTFFIISY